MRNSYWLVFGINYSYLPAGARAMERNALTKDLNLSRIMHSVWMNDGISRIDVARLLGLNKSTVTSLVAELMERKIIHETAEGDSSPHGGRKPIGLSVDKNNGYILGIEIQPEFINATAVNLHGEIIGSMRRKAAVSEDSLQDIFFSVLDDCRLRFSVFKLPLIGIGIGMSGIIDPFQGVIRQSMPLRIRRPYDFMQRISSRIGIPAYIENDARCCAWGELVVRRSVQPGNFLTVLGFFEEGDIAVAHRGGIAVGFGIVIDQHVYCGKDYSAGEFKSLFWKPGNDSQFSLTGDESLILVKDKEVRTRFIRELSDHIAFLVNTFNLNNVFFAGSLEEYSEEISPVLRERIANNWPYPGAVECGVEFSSHGEKAVAYGAAAMLLDRLFSQSGMPTVKGGRELLDITLLQ